MYVCVCVYVHNKSLKKLTQLLSNSLISREPIVGRGKQVKVLDGGKENVTLFFYVNQLQHIHLHLYIYIYISIVYIYKYMYIFILVYIFNLRFVFVFVNMRV